MQILDDRKANKLSFYSFLDPFTLNIKLSTKNL